MKQLVLIWLVFVGVFSIAQNRQYIHKNWTFNQEGSTQKYPANVPGTVHQDLMNNAQIEAIYFENNEHKYRWIENENWIYETSFDVNFDLLNHPKIYLVFEGLDTYADVYLNGDLILSAHNMFRRWEVDVKEMLQLKGNQLKIKFTSPITKHKNDYKNAKYELPAGNESVDIKVSPYVRKSGYHFGWDWGPRIVTCGIWKNVYLQSQNDIYIENISVLTNDVKRDSAWITYQIQLNNTPLNINSCKVLINDVEADFVTDKNASILTVKKIVSNPKLWWPNGFGEPHLYSDKISLQLKGQQVISDSVKYGIRKIELINEPDSIGTSFYFKINNQPIFVRGANYIPQDLLIPRVTDQQYEQLLTKVVDANMNMIRVWGGGIYEKEVFYDLCDELGIMVWQDFMFAGSMYPNSESFLNNVKAEVHDNVTRISKHPSVVIWCGNNEMEVAWHNWGWQKTFGYSAKDSTEIIENYKYIFHDLIPNELKKIDATVPYTSTSPLSNWGKAENFNHSSMHYWGVWHGREPFENFEKNVGRFMVEYGFQSFPNVDVLKKVMTDSSLYLTSEAMKNRQKSYIGNGLIEKHIKQYLGESKNFESFVLNSQKVQAIGMEMAIQAHRKNMPHCMGTMFWQLNDCWPGPSWSVIDYYGNNKLAYGTVKTNYNPILILKNNEAYTIVSNVPKTVVKNIKVVVKTEKGNEKTLNWPIVVEPLTVKTVDAKHYKKRFSVISVEVI